MQKTLPTPNEMYQALFTRDTSYDGVFFAGIRTTGVFCRPGCGARKPRRENVAFFADTTEALRAGYRPCLRCKPLRPAGETPAWVQQVFDLAENRTEERLTADDLRSAGIEPARAARYFKTHYGVTFQAYHRARRLGRALHKIRNGTAVGRQAIRSGFESESGFREAFTRLFGAPPAQAAASNPARKGGPASTDAGAAGILYVRWLSTPLGPMLAAASDEGVYLLEFADRRALQTQINTLRRRVPGAIMPGDHPHLQRLAEQLEAYFAGKKWTFDIPLAVPGSSFQEKVWAALRRIPPGQTRSYAQIAREIGRPAAVRAVARANGDNRLALLIPCHRVIGADGSLSGYGGGVWRKQWLLEHERAGKQD